MSTFNGWPIYILPAFPPAPKSIEWELDDVQGSVQSPFSLQRQIFDWQSSILRGSVSYQPQTAAQFRQWMAFLAELRGINGVFSIGDPVNTHPQNSGAAAGTVTGSGQTGYSLITSSSGLLPGDWFSLGLRLYLVTSVSGGTLGIWPQIRESPADGTDLVIVNATGLFRLQKNKRTVSVHVGPLYSVTFEIEEAL